MQVLSILTFNRDGIVSIVYIYRCHETIWCYQLYYCLKRVHLKMMMLTNSLKLLRLSMSLKVPSFLGSKNIPNTIWPRRVFHFHDNPFLDQFLYFLANDRIFVLIKGVARKPVLIGVGKQLNTGSQNIRQNYTIMSRIFPCGKMSSDSPRLEVVATVM